MDNEVLSRIQDCISNLIEENKDDSIFETFQDIKLFVVRDLSQYADLEDLQKVYPIQVPLIVGCHGKKAKHLSETLLTKEDYHRNNNKSRSDSTNHSGDQSNNNNNIADYEGQPLEMNVYADLSHIETANLNSPSVIKKEKTSFSPVRLSYGRRLLSAYSSLMLSPAPVKDGSEIVEQIPILLYCTGEDYYRTAYVYISPSTVKSKTVLKYVKISVEEAKDVSTITATSLLPDLRQRSTLAEYNVYDGSLSYNNVVVERPSRIILQAEWDKSFTFLDKPAPNSKVSVKAKIIAGDVNAPTYPKFQELCKLKGFFECLGNREVRWSVKKKDDIAIMDNLKDLFELLKLGDAQVDEDIEKSEEGNIPQNILMTHRKDHDFTDKLWNVLKCCTSYSELIECLEFMLQELKSKNLQPPVHKTNKTRIAEIVRSSYTNELCFPDMEGVLPLKLLIEIGIEKLRNDYISLLMANELTTSDQLLYYTDRSCTLQERMERLEKLHNVYELVMILNFYLNISESTLLSFAARMALSHFQKQLLDDNHTFILPVSPDSVAPFLMKETPYLWKLSLEEAKDQTNGTVFAFFETLPFDHIAMKDDYPESLSYYLVKFQEHLMML